MSKGYPVNPGGDPEHLVQPEPSPRRIRAELAGVIVADSSRALLVRETDHLPQYYLPMDDLRAEHLEPSEHSTTCPYKGQARYYHLRVGDRLVPNACWTYPEPFPGAPDLSRYGAFYWDRLDHWYEEDEEVFVHARDPYHRVDALRSSRHVRVVVGERVVAETRRPVLVFETHLPTRYYIPPEDVRGELLVRSSRLTRCPYKGLASYWSIADGDERREDAAWAYLDPLPALASAAGYYCFYPEKVTDLEVD